MEHRVLNTRVAGVTYEGRQDYLAQLSVNDACRLEPEPTNQYDPNAIAVKVSHNSEIWHVGYIPKEVAEQIAPHLDGENLMCRIAEITGGFMIDFDRQASYGLRLTIELPPEDNNA